jgi:hypothetical protein
VGYRDHSRERDREVRLVLFYRICACCSLLRGLLCHLVWRFWVLRLCYRYFHYRLIGGW